MQKYSPTHLHICNFKWDKVLWIILYLHCSFCKLTKKKKSHSPYGSSFVPMPLFTSTPIRLDRFFFLTPNNLTWRQRHWKSFFPPIAKHVCVHGSILILTQLSSQYQHAHYTYRTELLELQSFTFSVLSVYAFCDAALVESDGAWQYSYLGH